MQPPDSLSVRLALESPNDWSAESCLCAEVDVVLATLHAAHCFSDGA